VKCSPDNGSFFVPTDRQTKEELRLLTRRTRIFPARLFTLYQPEAGDWKESSSLSPLHSQTPLLAEDAGWWTPISGPERDPVPEACSPNGMPLQGPFLDLKDVDIRTPGPMTLN
jgi:hypothetical protein